MNDARRDRDTPRPNRLGGLLIALSLGAVVIAYPPPVTGVGPVFGVGNVFLPLIVSVVALLLAIGGGVLLARSFARTRSDRGRRLAVRILLPVGAVTVVSVYLTVGAGFGSRAFLVGPAVIAAVVGLGDALLD